MRSFRNLPVLLLVTGTAIHSQQTSTYARIKARLDAIPAIDTHEHIQPFSELPGRVQTASGLGVNLFSVWKQSYYSAVHRLTPWTDGQDFDQWWSAARNDFADAKAASFYRYQLSAFKDLYGVDFETMTPAQARDLDRRIFENYKTPAWIRRVVDKANIELMLFDPRIRFDFEPPYDFAVLALRVNPLLLAFHPDETPDPLHSPYSFAAKRGLPMRTLDDYVGVLDRLFQDAAQAGIVCLKYSGAYRRTLQFDNVQAASVASTFGRRRQELNAQQIKAFEDFVFWKLCELAAKYDLPFQVHTGHGRLQGSNPMLLLDLIEANPRTKFVLFHGGFPWTGETGAIAMRNPGNVWIDSVWLPTLSFSMARRALHEWLEMVPSTKIMWGGDALLAEGLYGGTVFTRECLAEVLAEKVDQRRIKEADALRIGRQILRDNALALFPSMRKRLWRKDVPRE
ncbi:MAG: hypothetical protein FJW40_22810 [Acidobacteria bacterium]|nr:hypothetical protein [Acidobacteriota bacterium]